MFKIYNLNDMIDGWFVGNFTPAAFTTDSVEVSIKKYKKGDFSEKHYHKIATELTVIVEGRVMMNGVEYCKDAIIVIKPDTSTDFLALTDVTTVVVKLPSKRNDKFIE